MAALAPEAAPRRLNWGCGDHTAGGWLNVDVKSGPNIDLTCDIRDGLPLESESFDYAVSIHALPELSYSEVVPALVELRRVLRPGGVLRLALPDLRRAVRAYVLGSEEYFEVGKDEARSLGGRFILHILWYGYSKTLFTEDFIEELLVGAGFESVAACRYMDTQSRYPEIVGLDNRQNESLFVEATKPLRDREGSPRPTQSSGLGTERGYHQGVPRLEIQDVAPAEDEGLRAARIDAPVAGSRLDAGPLKIVGWVVGRKARAVAVEVLNDGNLVGSTPVQIERPGVAEAFAEAPGAKTAGFRLMLEASGVGQSELLVRAVLEDETRAPIATIRTSVEGKRGFLRALRRS